MCFKKLFPSIILTLVVCSITFSGAQIMSSAAKKTNNSELSDVPGTSTSPRTYNSIPHRQITVRDGVFYDNNTGKPLNGWYNGVRMIKGIDTNAIASRDGSYRWRNGLLYRNGEIYTGRFSGYNVRRGRRVIN